MVDPIRVVIHGAAGRMGAKLVALASSDPAVRLAAAIEYAAHPQLGCDAGVVAGVAPTGILLQPELPPDADADVLIDFSSPAGAAHAVSLCAERHLPLVMATTGLQEATKNQIRQLANTVAVVWSPNMSLAVNLTMKLVEQAAGVLKDHPTGVDVEIIERHHRFKEDAPSGTALRLGELVAAAMGQTRHVHGRHGMLGKRPRDEIGYHALRAGDNPGEHTVVFAMLGETIELTVKASSRDCYAAGALEAAKFAARQPPGLYSMLDVLGLTSRQNPSG